MNVSTVRKVPLPIVFSPVVAGKVVPIKPVLAQSSSGNVVVPIPIKLLAHSSATSRPSNVVSPSSSSKVVLPMPIPDKLLAQSSSSNVVAPTLKLLIAKSSDGILHSNYTVTNTGKSASPSKKMRLDLDQIIEGEVDDEQEKDESPVLVASSREPSPRHEDSTFHATDMEIDEDVVPQSEMAIDDNDANCVLESEFEGEFPSEQESEPLLNEILAIICPIRMQEEIEDMSISTNPLLGELGNFQLTIVFSSSQ